MALLLAEGSSLLGDVDAWVALDHGNHRALPTEAVLDEALPVPVTSHYAVIAGEIAILPLVVYLPAVAGILTILNAAVLTIRIRAENRATAASREAIARDDA